MKNSKCARWLICGIRNSKCSSVSPLQTIESILIFLGGRYDVPSARMKTQSDPSRTYLNVAVFAWTSVSKRPFRTIGHHVFRSDGPCHFTGLVYHLVIGCRQ